MKPPIPTKKIANLAYALRRGDRIFGKADGDPEADEDADEDSDNETRE